MATFEVVQAEGQKMVKVTLEGDTVRAESGALHYFLGNIEVQSKSPTAGGVLSGMLTGEKIFKPVYTGHGEVFLGPPNFGEYVVLKLDNESWVLDQGAYVCSDADISVGAHRNKAMSALMGGEGFYQTLVKGTGTVVIQAPGQVERVALQGQRLAVDGRFAVARTASVDFRVQRATRSVIGTVTSGEGLLNIYQGQGTVLLCPVPNLYQSLIRRSTVLATPASAGPRAPTLKAKLIAMGCLAVFFGLIVVLVGMAALFAQIR